MKVIDNEAAKLVDEFEKAALQFSEIQQEHTRFLRGNQLTDVSKWQDERSQAMGNLQQALNAVWRCEPLKSDARLGLSLQEKIGAIVKRERILAADVKLRQEHLKNEMGKIRRGKKAIGGYGANSKNTGFCFKNSF
jgi:hypothetical protein